MSHPDTAVRFPGEQTSGTTAMNASFYDLTIAGQAGSSMDESTALIVDDRDQVAAAPAIMIDNGQEGGYSESGVRWRNGSSGSDNIDYQGTGYRYKRRTSQPGSATWNFAPGSGGPGHAAGTYRVEVRFRESTSWTTSAKYVVHHSGGPTNVWVNQQSGGGQWMSIGTYTFAANSARVVLEKDPDDGFICADAVRLVEPLPPGTGRRFEIVSGPWRERSDGNNEAYTRPGDSTDWFLKTNTGSSSTDTLTFTARWYPHVTEDANYEIFSRFRDTNGYDRNVSYTICHANGCVTSEDLDHRNDGGPQWNAMESTTIIPSTLSTNLFPFTVAGGDSEYIELSWVPDDHGDRDVCADAIAWVKEDAAAAAQVDIVNSHYYYKGTDDNIYLVNMTGNVLPAPGTLQRRVYLFASADQSNIRDTVGPNDLVEVTDLATLQSVGLLLADSKNAKVAVETDGTGTSVTVNGLAETVDTDAYFTVEDDASGTFYRVTGSTIDTIPPTPPCR